MTFYLPEALDRRSSEAPLAPEERVRYARQLSLPAWGEAGQRRLRAAAALVVGMGGLGCPVALHLVAAGIGRLGLVDPDAVHPSNLPRQTLYAGGDVGAPKVAAAARRLRAMNPAAALDLYPVRADAGNALALMRPYDLVVDATDNFEARYLLSDACLAAGKPLVSASIYRFEGQIGVFCAPGGPCLRCVYPAPPPPALAPDCAAGGVLGVTTGLLGTLQALEALKLISGVAAPLSGKLLVVDLLRMDFRAFGAPADPACPACARPAQALGLERPGAACRSEAPPEISVHELRRRLDAGRPVVLLDVRTPPEAALATLGGALVPLAELPARLPELAPHRAAEIVVYCRSGARSAEATALLRAAGFAGAVNLAGGILAWSAEIGPPAPVY